jgi:ABC-type cobalt transport system substrate-binding protein
MADACPIAGCNVNKSVVRISAFLTFVAVLIFLFTPAKWIILLLAVDLFLRSFVKGKHSPVRTASIVINTILKLKPNMVNSGPTIFAAKIGFICSLLISLSYMFGFLLVGYVVGSILAICAALEAFLGYCVGCKLYSLIPRK